MYTVDDNYQIPFQHKIEHRRIDNDKRHDCALRKKIFK